MVEIRKPIKVNEAMERVMAFAKNVDIEFVLIEDCDGHFLGEI